MVPIQLVLFINQVLDALIAQYGEPDRYTTAERYKLDLGNGWVVSGEYDIIDHKYKIIIDGVKFYLI